MLSFTEFTDELIVGCKKVLGEEREALTEIEMSSVSKPQRGSLTGLRFIREGSRIAPVLYAEDMYSRYTGGCPVDRIAREAVESILRSFDISLPFSEEDLDLKNMTDDIRPRLISRERNSALMQSVPCMDAGGGLILIADVVRGEYRAMITKDMLNDSEISEDELFDIALGNMPEDEAVLFRLSDMVHTEPDERPELLGGSGENDPSGDSDVFLLSNRDMFWGAAALFYPGVRDRLHEIIGDFYVIPSSVHELLLLSVSADADPDNLSEMIWAANRSVVDEDDVLSDDLFICRSGSFRLVRCCGYTERENAPQPPFY